MRNSLGCSIKRRNPFSPNLNQQPFTVVILDCLMSRIWQHFQPLFSSTRPAKLWEPDLQNCFFTSLVSQCVAHLFQFDWLPFHFSGKMRLTIKAQQTPHNRADINPDYGANMLSVKSRKTVENRGLTISWNFSASDNKTLTATTIKFPSRTRE